MKRANIILGLGLGFVNCLLHCQILSPQVLLVNIHEANQAQQLLDKVGVFGIGRHQINLIPTGLHSQYSLNRLRGADGGGLCCSFLGELHQMMWWRDGTLFLLSGLGGSWRRSQCKQAGEEVGQSELSSGFLNRLHGGQQEARQIVLGELVHVCFDLLTQSGQKSAHQSI